MPAEVATNRHLRMMGAAALAVLVLILAGWATAAVETISLDPADQALDAGQVRRARELYLTVNLLAADPGLAARAAEQAAWCESLLGRHDVAATRLDDLLRGLEGDGGRRARLLNLLGEVRLNQALSASDPASAQRSFAAAERAFRDALVASGDAASTGDPIRYNLGRCLYHAERYDDARATLSPLATRGDGSALSSQAALLVHLTELKDALRDPAASPRVGEILARLGDAVAGLDDGLLANEAVSVAATSLLAAGRPGDALVWARRVTPRDGLLRSVGASEVRLRNALASAEAAGSDADALRRELQRLRARHDELGSLPDPGLHAELIAAECLLGLGDTEESVATFRRLLRRDDLSPGAAARVRTGLIRACATIGDPERAVSVLEDVHATLGPEASAELAFAVAQTAIQTEDLALAAETLDLCRRLSPAGPRAPATLYQEGALRLSLGEHARAANLLERFLDQEGVGDSRASDAWFRLGCARTALGEYDNAAVAIERSLALSGPEFDGRRHGLIQLARLRILADRPEEALRHLDELEADGAGLDDDERRLMLLARADAYDALGQHERSAAVWQEFSRYAASPLDAAAALWRAALELDAAGLEAEADRICSAIASSEIAGAHRRAARQRLVRRALARDDPAAAAAILAETAPDRPDDLLALARLWLDQASRGGVDRREGVLRAREAYERCAVEFAEMPEAAEALYLLSELQEKSGDHDEAARTRARLTRGYRSSPWARKVRPATSPQGTP